MPLHACDFCSVYIIILPTVFGKREAAHRLLKVFAHTQNPQLLGLHIRIERGFRLELLGPMLNLAKDLI